MRAVPRGRQLIKTPLRHTTYSIYSAYNNSQSPDNLRSILVLVWSK